MIYRGPSNDCSGLCAFAVVVAVAVVVVVAVTVAVVVAVGVAGSVAVAIRNVVTVAVVVAVGVAVAIGVELMLRMWTIYERPADYPRGYVVRRVRIAAGVVYPDGWQCADTLEAARELVPRGTVRIERDPRDVPEIVESWL